MGAPLLVVSALAREVHPLARRLMARKARLPAGLGAWEASVSARQVYLAATGCGSGPAVSVMGRLLADLRPACVVSTGICGALLAGPRTGQIVLADRVRHEGEGSAREAPQVTLAPTAAALSEVAIPVQRGGLASLHRVVRSPGEKERVAREMEAIAVDMESAWVAEECDRAQVPWVVVRAVMDGVERPPAIDYGRFIAPNGDVRLAGIAFHALLRPWLWTAMFVDGERMKEATESLARALTRVLASLGAVVQ